jgi:putative membrane protein
MNRRWARWVMIGAMVMGGSALAQEQKPGDPQKMERAGRPNPQQKQQALMGGMMVPEGEQAFLSKLHAVHQTEIALGELTQQKATAPAVRQYGEHMVREHKKADQQLMDYAKQHGLRLGKVEPTNDVQRVLENATEANKAKLAALQGPLYDQEYLASMVADHDQVLQLVMLGRQTYPQHASMLDGLMPSLRQHRDQAYQLLGQASPQQRQARPPPGEHR